MKILRFCSISRLILQTAHWSGVVDSGGIPLDVQQPVQILHEAQIKLGVCIMKLEHT